MRYTKEQYIADAKLIWEQHGFKEVVLCLIGIIVFFALLSVILYRFDKKVKAEQAAAPKIVAAKYLGEVVVGTKRGGFKGAMVGGILYGDVGAAVGGMAPKGVETRSRFAVQYDTGEVKIQDCIKDSTAYKTYMSYVQWDDL